VAASVTAGVVASTGGLARIRAASGVCGTTGFFAARRLTAAVAARVADAEHTVEQLEPIALANHAHAKHERSKNQFQFHRATSPFRVEPASCAHSHNPRADCFFRSRLAIVRPGRRASALTAASREGWDRKLAA